MSEKHCGYVALVGRPNVGKSTLMNHLLGEKISVTSRKPQTTRHKVLGVKTDGETQIIFVDTPGIHQDIPRKINRYMNKAALSAFNDVDLVCFVVDSVHFNAGDEFVFNQVKKCHCPVILVINKMDTVDDQAVIYERVKNLSDDFQFAAVVPVSATSGFNLDKLMTVIQDHLPESEFFYFPEDAKTDKDARFQISEIIREKLMRLLSKELPYETHVVIEQLSKEEKITRIDAAIYVARDSQKGIVIGKGGSMLKKIGTQARISLERYLDHKVMLKLYVKVKDNWSDSDQLLQSYGYDNE